MRVFWGTYSFIFFFLHLLFLLSSIFFSRLVFDAHWPGVLLYGGIAAATFLSQKLILFLCNARPLSGRNHRKLLDRIDNLSFWNGLGKIQVFSSQRTQKNIHLFISPFMEKTIILSEDLLHDNTLAFFDEGLTSAIEALGEPDSYWKGLISFSLDLIFFPILIFDFFRKYRLLSVFISFLDIFFIPIIYLKNSLVGGHLVEEKRLCPGLLKSSQENIQLTPYRRQIFDYFSVFHGERTGPTFIKNVFS